MTLARLGSGFIIERLGVALLCFCFVVGCGRFGLRCRLGGEIGRILKITHPKHSSIKRY
jgi:hypothetical protein